MGLETVPSDLDRSGRAPKPAQPLPAVEDQEEKARLIAQILELQNTLEGMPCVAMIGGCR